MGWWQREAHGWLGIEHWYPPPSQETRRLTTKAHRASAAATLAFVLETQGKKRKRWWYGRLRIHGRRHPNSILAWRGAGIDEGMPRLLDLDMTGLNAISKLANSFWNIWGKPWPPARCPASYTPRLLSVVSNYYLADSLRRWLTS